MRSDDVQELKAKAICFRCVGEPYLREEIRTTGKQRICSYCENSFPSFTLDEVAERVEAAFAEHYLRTSDQPDSWEYSLLSDKESNYSWERHGVPVLDAIADAANLPELAAEDIQQILDEKYWDFEATKAGEETEFSSDSYYEEKGASDAGWQEEWRAFETSLKTEARFFSRAAAEHLASVFADIAKMHTRDGRPLVVDAGPGFALSSIYRARIFQSDARLEVALCRPDQHLGSPPPPLATAGRMNACGISVFYGASDPGVAIAEVRPPVGSQVAVARFEIIRPLRLLDLTAVSDVSATGSIFDPDYARRLERTTFLRSLSGRITRPVMPDDETFEYLATQALADFLATIANPPLDGILFPSAQAASGALNVVLFHKSARVEPLALPAGTEIDARTGIMGEDGWETEYVVIEETPPIRPVDSDRAVSHARQVNLSLRSAWPQEPTGYDAREATLRIDNDSVRVHQVKRVQFDTAEFSVRRHRWQKRELGF